MRNTIWIVPIEPLDTRYTKQWYETIPEILNRSDNFDIINVDVRPVKKSPTKGAFLDFAHTNVYKARQVEYISEMFVGNMVKPGDKFLVTDAWNFVIPAIKYMSDLLDIPVEIHGIWHAGAYDPTDILGMKMEKPWPYEFERSCFYACDYNYYGTNFHKDMFLRNLKIHEKDHYKAIRSGQPHNAIVRGIEEHVKVSKKEVVLWPHRYNADKQPEIFEDLIPSIKGNCVITQKLDLSKDQYYEIMGEASVVFSCALHENLGISIMEGVLAGAVPIVPDRASYKEMYLDEFKYPSHWTESFEAYKFHKEELVDRINNVLANVDEFDEALDEQRKILIRDYLHADIMIHHLLNNKLDKTGQTYYHIPMSVNA